MKIPPHQDPVEPGTPRLMPAISEGFDNVGDGAVWRHIAVPQYHQMSWPLWGRGSAMVAGRPLRHAFEAHLEHSVYLAVVPLPRLYQPVDMRKTSRLP